MQAYKIEIFHNGTHVGTYHSEVFPSFDSPELRNLSKDEEIKISIVDLSEFDFNRIDNLRY